MADEENTDLEASPESSKDGAVEAPKVPLLKRVPLILLLGAFQILLSIGSGTALVYLMGEYNKPQLKAGDLKERAIASLRDDADQIQNVAMEPFILNTLSKQSLKAELSLEVSDSQTAELLKSRMPAMRSRVLNLLSQQSPDTIDKLQDKLVLKDAIRETLQEELRMSGLNKGVIRDVYFINLLLL